MNNRKNHDPYEDLNDREGMARRREEIIDSLHQKGFVSANAASSGPGYPDRVSLTLDEMENLIGQHNG